MELDMSKAEEPVQAVPAAEPEKEGVYNLTLTREELDILKNALAESENFKTLVKLKAGEAENKLLLGLEKF